ncbi:MAG: hypothetical protein IT270_17585 [Saprospiraceae bacterium]|nr:hypothetical protein [Saprospiraceae bacterium]
MEDWELDFEWLRVQHLVRDAMRRENLPDLNTVLFLIGIQELGRWKKDFTKEEKQDLMHIAVCELLCYEEFFEFAGRDADGWPHYRQVRELNDQNMTQQERYLKIQAVRYFKDLEQEEKVDPA